MVGKRSWNPSTDSAETKKQGLKSRNHNEPPKLLQFRETGEISTEDERREELKNKLIHGIDKDTLDRFRKTPEEVKKFKNKKLRRFYEDQNERLNDWLEVDALVEALADDIFESFNPDRDLDGIAERAGALQNIGEDMEAFLPEEERQRRKKGARKAKWAVIINVIANVFLLAAKIGAVFFSSSLSLIASLLDSALDLLCTLIVWTTNQLVQWRLHSLRARFPVGRRRLEPLGILVFSIIMIFSFLQILQESITKLLPSGDHLTAALPNIAIFAMAATIVVKGIIWFGCIPIKTTQVQALAQDCKTDVFFNTLSLLFPAIGHKLDIWWLDPAGAGLLSIFIIYDWGATSFQNVVRLSGSTVDDRLLQKIMFVAYRFSPLVNGFKSVVAYHAGDGVWVEIDVLLDPQEPLIRAHDIAETMQYCLEGLKEVDRAFVTTDYTSFGPTGHSITALG